MEAASGGAAAAPSAARQPVPAALRRRGAVLVAKSLVIVLILTYGAALRLIAITEVYGPVAHPVWLNTAQQWATSTVPRPEALRWSRTELFPHRDGPPTQYRSDPYTYLQYGREMRSFYAAHRREPLFPFATKISLWLLSDQDVAVSFASAAFSVLAIAATFLVGVMAFNYAVGATAAALMAIEYDLITWGVGGWRDDAFMAGVLLTCAALLRLRSDPGWRSGVILGVVMGAACLIRITSLSFIVPGLAVAAVLPSGSRRKRLAGALVATGVAALMVAPFLINCWRVYGDPLYSINVHATVYRETEGQPGNPSLTVSDYLGGQFRSRPIRTIDTVAQGLTVYPFANKWTGFERWHASFGRWLSYAAIIGLILSVASPTGRLLLLVLVTSLLPYAPTWKLISDWRFTEHAYPFFLLAAALTFVGVFRALALVRRRDRGFRANVRPRLAWVGTATAVAALTWLLMERVIPVYSLRETLRSGEPAVITALERDTAFFSGDWTPGPPGNVPTRVTTQTRADILVPLPEPSAYDLVLRVDPSSDPIGEGDEVPRIQLLVNGRLMARCEPGSSPTRIGLCRLRIPAGVARAGMNRLTLVTESSSARGFRLWYVRVEPAEDGTA